MTLTLHLFSGAEVAESCVTFMSTFALLGEAGMGSLQKKVLVFVSKLHSINIVEVTGLLATVGSRHA